AARCGGAPVLREPVRPPAGFARRKAACPATAFWLPLIPQHPSRRTIPHKTAKRRTATPGGVRRRPNIADHSAREAARVLEGWRAVDTAPFPEFLPMTACEELDAAARPRLWRAAKFVLFLLTEGAAVLLIGFAALFVNL